MWRRGGGEGGRGVGRHKPVSADALGGQKVVLEFPKL